jgi:iron complex outermembrane recepter protein
MRNKSPKSQKSPRQRQRALLRPPLLAATPVMSAVLAAIHPAYGQDSDQPALEEVVVSAQKRTESLQNVPLSITALNTQKLEELHVEGFNDYAKFLPSVTFQTFGPGFAKVLIRGISADNNPNHSGPLPTVGTYLDEQPITTIQGALDLHLYDIARVEALAGPQGTLYGASSEAGTVRIITNKPDVSAFSGNYEIEGNFVDHGGPGGVVQGYVNIPLSSAAAVRLVGWVEHDSGYIDNVYGTRTFPQFGITINNAGRAKSDINDVTTYGGRGALKVDLNDSWTLTPVIMGQETRAGGFYGYDPAIRDLEITHFYPDDSEDHFVDLALTLEGKISNFDLVYAGAYLKRDDITHSDYSDYALAYDMLLPSYTAPIIDNAGNHINPSQIITGKDGYEKQSHEIRLSSPQDWRLHLITGLFYQRQSHRIQQNLQIDALAQSLWVTGWPDTWWLTEQVRVDRDYAAFGEVTFDIVGGLSITGGLRFYRYDNSLDGYRGFGLNNPLALNSTPFLGEAGCISPQAFNGAPCLSFNKDTSGTGHIPKVSLTYKFDPDHLIYATYSKGFRPGGINRVGNLPPYAADFLKNYEVGWKTSWMNNRLRFNGAVYREDWDNFQFSFLGPNSLTQIANAGAARVWGVESELNWAVTAGLTLSSGITLMNPKITENYCGAITATGAPITDCADPKAPAGTQLPSTSKIKGNLVARYAFGLMGYEAHAQAAFVYQSAEWDDLRIAQREAIGPQPAFGTLDLAGDLSKSSITWSLYVTNVFDKRGQLYRYDLCGSCNAASVYAIPTQPRTIGLKFGQKF